MTLFTFQVHQPRQNFGAAVRFHNGLSVLPHRRDLPSIRNHGVSRRISFIQPNFYCKWMMLCFLFLQSSFAFPEQNSYYSRVPPFTLKNVFGKSQPTKLRVAFPHLFSPLKKTRNFCFWIFALHNRFLGSMSCGILEKKPPLVFNKPQCNFLHREKKMF